MTPALKSSLPPRVKHPGHWLWGPAYHVRREPLVWIPKWIQEHGDIFTIVAPLGRDLLLQELLVGLLLDLDEVRDLDDGRDLTEVLADPAPALDVARHTPSAPRLPRGWVRPAAVTHSGESGAAPGDDTLV